MAFVDVPALRGKRVLVTGGTGFIGGRLVEALVEGCQADVRVLMRTFSHAARVARFPVELVAGDIVNPTDVERAVAGVDVVFHCAFGTSGGKSGQRLGTVEGTRNVLSAATKAGVKRVVHLSTVMVYGGTRVALLNEDAPRRYSGNVYGDSKLDAERIALDFHKSHGLGVSVLQPTVVYGPYSLGWTVNVLRQLRRDTIPLVDGGEGTCNAVYVDDLVSAMLLSAVQDRAVGEAFLISGEKPVTWREFYGRYEQMLGYSSTTSLSAKDATTAPRRRGLLGEAWRILKEDPRLRERVSGTAEVAALMRMLPDPFVKRVQQAISRKGPAAPPGSRPPKPLRPLSPLMAELFASRTSVSIDKAKRILGYEPAFDLAAGMAMTEHWARWANLLEPE